MHTIRIGRTPLELSALRRIAYDSTSIALDPACHAAIRSASAHVNAIAQGPHAAYGINTGFGKLAQTRIARDDLAALQRNLVRSHAVGLGPDLPDPTVRLLMALKIATLAQGHSGVALETVEALVALYRHQVYPCIPAQGSVGASGDLAPLAHLAAVLIGEGDVRVGAARLPAREGLRQAGLQPLTLGPKEGLALLNGTQASTALALIGLFQAENVFAAAIVAGAMSVDAAAGSDDPFDARIHTLRGHAAQIDCARQYRELLAGSAIRASHREEDDRVQDPYSLRCQPQVMGACLDTLRYAARVLTTEANGVTDNPLVFADSGEVLSGGNFHAEPVALVADAMATAIAEVGALAERRIALLIDASISRLPPFLVRNSGLNSGFMIAQVTAAALASENKSLAHPASVDSLPTSANQEDHVSMATFAARRLGPMGWNTAGIVAIELLAAAQGIDLRAPLATSVSLTEAYRLVRGVSAFYDDDRSLASDIASLQSLAAEGAFNRFVASLLSSLPT